MPPFGYEYSFTVVNIVTCRRRFSVNQDQHTLYMFYISCLFVCFPEVNNNNGGSPFKKKNDKCL